MLTSRGENESFEQKSASLWSAFSAYVLPWTPLNSGVEAVEKVPKHILGRDAEKSDLIECATINHRMPRKGQVLPKPPLNRGKGVFLQAP